MSRAFLVIDSIPAVAVEPSRLDYSESCLHVKNFKSACSIQSSDLAAVVFSLALYASKRQSRGILSLLDPIRKCRSDHYLGVIYSLTRGRVIQRYLKDILVISVRTILRGAHDLFDDLLVRLFP